MTIRTGWTLAALAALGGTASAHPVQDSPAGAEVLAVAPSHRGVADDYLVLPSGAELGGELRFVTADASFAGRPLKFTDLALFGLSTRWSIVPRLELDARIDLLPKQPSYTDEKTWQSFGLAFRGAPTQHIAIALGASGGRLMAHPGAWLREGATVEYKKPIHDEFLSFDLQGGVDAMILGDAGSMSRASLVETTVQTAALFHEPSGHWGAWIGASYAVPVAHGGHDPVTMLAIDPQPRLDFHAGTVLAIVPAWDLYVDFAVIDRGDASNPATQLPVLDGGFDQRQIMFGVTRHITSGRDDHHNDSEDYGLRL